jgi:hypothetical protein
MLWTCRNLGHGEYENLVVVGRILSFKQGLRVKGYWMLQHQKPKTLRCQLKNGV